MKYYLSLIVFLAPLLPSLAISTPVQWRAEDGGNGHWYEAINVESSWSEARAESELRAYNGYAGHLLTINSANENIWVTNNILPDEVDGLFWVGGIQPEGSQEPDGGWMWITDEEWLYTNWYTISPNDNPHNEDKLALYNYNNNNEGATWDDRRPDRILTGYIVEYESTEPVSLKPQISVVGGYIKLDVTQGGQPPVSDCNNPSHDGRMVLDNVNGVFYLCTTYGWISK